MIPRARRLAALVLAAACASDAGPPGPEPPASALELPAPSAGRPEIVLLVAVAGLAPGHYTGPDPPMPALARLAAGGVAAARVEPVAPAARELAHAALATGRRPASQRTARRSDTQESRTKPATLAEQAGLAGLPVAALGWPAGAGEGIPLWIPDAGRLGETEAWLAALADRATPALLERARAAGGADPATAAPGPARDATLVRVACGLLGDPTPPALLLLALEDTRVAAEALGPGAPGTAQAFRRADAALALLVRCLGAAGRLERAALLVAGDHAFVPVHTELAPNARLAAEGVGERTAVRSSGGAALVYASSEDDALRARRVLDADAAQRGFFRVVSAQELLAAGADPAAWFGLEARPGFVFVDDAAAPASAASAVRAAGGYLPGRAEMEPGFVAWGAGIATGVAVPWMRQVDVAPLAARLLGVGLDDADGSEIPGLVRLPPEPAEPATRAPFEEDATP